MPPRHIVIVGGGFAGAVTAIKLLDGAAGPLAVTIVEPRAELGRGVAYSTVEPVHLVNGAAQGFGLHPDTDPDHLVRWLAEHGAQQGWALPENLPMSTPPRWLYGSYVQAQLQRAIAEAPQVAFTHRQQRAVQVVKAGQGWAVTLDDGAVLDADEVVLALGVFQGPVPTSETAVVGHPGYVTNPWEPAALDRLADARDVLLIGSSLSMVDVIASLEARGFAGTYHVVSRRGQVVEPRGTAPAWRDFLSGRPLPRTARALVAALKAEHRAVLAEGGSWQGMPMAIRPHILALWQGASREERLRFARHLRAFWDVAAHRAAPTAYKAVSKARDEQRFFAKAGRVLGLAPAGEKLAAEVRWRQSGAIMTLVVDGVINCRGHQLHDWSRIDDPLVTSLLATGLVRPHDTGFGIDATTDGALIDAAGQVTPTLHAIGHPLRGVAWESSSITEQVVLAIALANKLLAEPQAARATA